jgi:Zn-dependent protease with chaperone function
MIALISAITCAALNALRGSGLGWLRPVIGAAAGLASWFAGSPIITAAIVAGGLWLWLTQPWGRWYMLGQGARELSGSPNWWEKPIEQVADRAFPNHRDRADALAWLISGTAFALPLAVFASPFWLVLTPATVAIYAASLAAVKIGPHVRVGEAGKGALIGLLAVILAGCAAPQREPNWGAISREVGRSINQR